MKMYDAGIIIIVSIMIMAFIIGVGSTKFLGPDNFIEEIAEDVIKAETGLSVDLTPTPPDKE